MKEATAIGRILLLFTVLVSSLASAGEIIQLMSPDRERLWRAYVPKIDDSVLTKQIGESMLYTDKEIPPAYQFQPLSNAQVGLPYTLFFSTSHRHNRIDPFTHGNLEFPWKDPGGLDNVPDDTVTEFRFLWLPPKDGGRWPVVVYRDALEKSRAVNMPIPTQGWRWLYPAGTVVGEVLLKNFTDGQWACYEIRTRTRDIDDWVVEVYRPFRDAHEIAETQPNGKTFFAAVGVRQYRKQDSHPQHAFNRLGAELVLPPINNARQLLMNSTFSPISGSHVTRTRDYFVEALTANDRDNIVPQGYDGAYLGTTSTTCRNCHQHVLKHVDSFDQRRDWYGYVKGSDGIFSFHPIAPDAIRTRGNAPTRIREEFARTGMVEMYDPARHPASVYRVIAAYANDPLASYPPTNRAIQGGTYR